MLSILHRLRRDSSGNALIEFAYVLPVLLGIGAVGLETGNFMLMNLRVSQAAANLADNVSRVGTPNSLGVKSIRELDINDSFTALKLQSNSYGLTTHGRVTLSSLEQNAKGGQWIHWQRCLGAARGAALQSRYGATGDGAEGKTAIAGMGPKNKEITAPSGTGVMFADISYTYQPLFSDALLGRLVGSIYSNRIIQSHAAFVVRDDRQYGDADNPSNPTSATRYTCDTYSAD